MGYSLGVDLGTTFVAAALANENRVEMCTLGDRSVVTPAAVYLRDDGTLITGEAANLRVVNSPDRVVREFKRRLGNPTPVTLGGEPYAVTALLAALLRDVLRKVTETQGEPPERVLLTHPANWGPFRRALFEEVPPHAGLHDPPLVTEPEAAAVHYAESRVLTEGETIAVYDLGGGTFDATVLRKGPAGVEILGTPEGIERLGGVDFDEAILSFVDYSASGALSELDMSDSKNLAALARLRLDCMQAKEALSVDTEATIPVFLPSGQFDVRITRSDFEDLVRAQIESTVGALSRTLQSAQVEPHELSAVLLVGGSSRIPLVARMVSAELGLPTVVDTHPKYAVALGAATLAVRAATSPVPSRVTVISQSPRDQAVAVDTSPGAPPEGLTPTGPASASPVPAGSLERTTTRPADRNRIWLVVVAVAVGLLLLAGIIMFVPFKVYSAPMSRSVPMPVRMDPSEPAVTVPTRGTSVRVGQAPSSVAVAPNGQRAYVTNQGTRTITVLDTSTNKVISTVPVPAGPPQFLAVAPDGRRLYVSVFNRQGTIRAITVLDTASNRVIATIPQPARPFQPAISQDGRQLWVPHRDISAVSVIDIPTSKVISRLKVAPNPRSVEFSADGTQAYVANESNVVTVIDTGGYQVLATITVGNGPYGAAPSPTRPVVASVNYNANTVSAIDTGTWRVVATIPVGRNPRDIAWAPDGRFAYVVNEGSKSVSVIDVQNNRVTATIPTEGTPTSIAVPTNGRQAYVTNLDSGTVTVLNLAA